MADQIIHTIKQARHANQPSFLKFKILNTDVASEILKTVLDSNENEDCHGLRILFRAREGQLRIIVPSHLHVSPASWLRSELIGWCVEGLINPADLQHLEIHLPTIKNFIGPFTGSAMIPDLAVTPIVDRVTRNFPSVVIESGWVESMTQCFRAHDIWLAGTGGAVKLFILVKYSQFHKSQPVNASLSLARMNSRGHVDKNHWEIFPIPNRAMEVPFITIDELFGNEAPAGLDREKKLPLNLDSLRERMALKLREAGYYPA